MSDRVKAEAVRIYKILAAQSFEDCYALTTSFKELPRQPGLYAIRNRTDVLYVGKALNVRGRFKTGHTALVTAFINGLSPTDIRIAVVTLSPYWVNSLDELESWMIAESKPRYNSRIPSPEVKKIMQLTDRVTILESLPPSIREALEEYGAETGLSSDQVVEMAIVHFLDLDAATFPAPGSLKSLGQLKEEIAILKLKLKAAGIETTIENG
jgi:hypothetical protein